MVKNEKSQRKKLKKKCSENFEHGPYRSAKIAQIGQTDDDPEKKYDNEYLRDGSDEFGIRKIALDIHSIVIFDLLKNFLKCDANSGEFAVAGIGDGRRRCFLFFEHFLILTTDLNLYRRLFLPTILKCKFRKNGFLHF